MLGAGFLRHFRWPAIAIAALLGVGDRALAEGRSAPVVVVVRTAGLADDARESFAEAVTARLERTGRDSFTLPPEAPTLSLRVELEAAIAAYHDLRPADAIRELASVIESFERVGAGLDRTELIDAFVYRALSAQALGRLAESEASIDRVLAIDPTYAPDAARYPPAFRRSVEARRALVRGSEIRLVVAPTADRILLDSAPVDPSGSSVAVPVGHHVIRIEAAHHRPRVESVDVPLEGVDLVVTLESDPVARLRDAESPDTPVDSLVDAARALGVDVIVLDVSQSGPGLHVVLFDSSEDLRAALDADAATEPAVLVERLYVSEVAPEPTVDEPRIAPSSAPRRRRRRALGIASGAAAAVGLALGLGFGLRGRDEFVGSFQRDAR